MSPFFFLIIPILFSTSLTAQALDDVRVNVRMTILLLPPTPLLTVEAGACDHFSFQLETDFQNTHGLNVKYFIGENFNSFYLLIGHAFIRDATLRGDYRYANLSYFGGGFARSFSRSWIIDGRIGVGPLWRVDKPMVLPVIKFGIGKHF